VFDSAEVGSGRRALALRLTSSHSSHHQRSQIPSGRSAQRGFRLLTGQAGSWAAAVTSIQTTQSLKLSHDRLESNLISCKASWLGQETDWESGNERELGWSWSIIELGQLSCNLPCLELLATTVGDVIATSGTVPFLDFPLEKYLPGWEETKGVVAWVDMGQFEALPASTVSDLHVLQLVASLDNLM
jgi:hypothetical protein